MCGILGQVVFDTYVHPPGKFPALQLLSHRGPDGQGEWFSSDRRTYLAHTRLAILDPTPAGYQPMLDASNRYVITFNGELYNHLSVRSLLPNTAWRGTSDTETLIELLAQRGQSAISQLKGMFAFALFDTVDQSLLLVRDRFGIKPLWVWHDTSVFKFASEVRPLLPDSSVQLTQEALSEYIAFGRMPSILPNFNGIYSIPPGSWMKVSQTGVIETGMWWPDSADITPPNTSLKKMDCVKRVRELTIKAVEEHLLSDVGVGAFLSGGIDSSIITLIAGRALGKQLKTFTVGFPNSSDHDERDIAQQVATLAGSEHHEIDVDEHTCLDWVKEAVLSFDIPSVDAINTYIVSKAVQQSGVKVALSGLGGDELFGGYPSFSSVPILSNLRYLPNSLRRLLIDRLPNSYREKLAGLTDMNTVNLTVARRRFVSKDKLNSMGLPDGTPAIPFVPSGLDTTGQISWGEMQGYMVPMILRDSDQMSMAVGLEIRVPFLDHELVEAVLDMPRQCKEGKGTKPLLVKAFQKELPSVVYNRPKQGFSLPMDSWIRGPLDSFTEDGIQAASHLLKTTAPTDSWQAFKEHKLHWTRIWSWCVLGHWASLHMVIPQL